MVELRCAYSTLRSALGSGNSDVGARGCRMAAGVSGGQAWAMSNYRRMWVPGGTYFFTVNLADRSSCMLVERIAALRESVRNVMRSRPFESIAWVVLPNHMHALWTLPDGDADYAKRWMRIKQGFCERVPRSEWIPVSRRSRNERGIWQRRYWEHVIRDERDLQNHIDYIHFNPVKHGYVERVAKWPHSSFHRHVRDGRLPPDWAANRRVE
jgi:putative transposase